MSEYLDKSEAVGEGYLQDWYIGSVSEDDEPVWTDAHIEELAKDFIVIPKDTPVADVAPVVRCKDCEHWGTRKADGYGFCCIWGASVKENAFCSSGAEKRTDTDG